MAHPEASMWPRRVVADNGSYWEPSLNNDFTPGLRCTYSVRTATSPENLARKQRKNYLIFKQLRRARWPPKRKYQNTLNRHGACEIEKLSSRNSFGPPELVYSKGLQSSRVGLVETQLRMCQQSTNRL